MGMTHAVLLCKPISRLFFFLKTRIAPPPAPPPAYICTVLLFAGLCREIGPCQQALTVERGCCVRMCVCVCVSICVHMLLQEGTLGFLCSKRQFSVEVANPSLSLREEEVGEWWWGGDMPSLPRIRIAQDDPHSCGTPSVNTDSPIHHRTPFHSTRPEYNNDLVPAAGSTLHSLKRQHLKMRR